MLIDRLKQALEVLGSDGMTKGNLREQGTTYLGEEVDDEVVRYIAETSRIIYSEIFTQAATLSENESMIHKTALAYTLLAGMAIGKRLGMEDGMEFAKKVELP